MTQTGSSSALFTHTLRRTRVHKSSIIEPDIGVVEKARNANYSLVDGDAMNFRDEEQPRTWDDMANDFVLDMKNKMIKKWVKETHAAKVQTERKMR